MSNIKLAISNIAWDKADDENTYKFLQDSGIMGLEIAPTRIFEQNPYEQLSSAKEYSNMLREQYNLNIISMQSIWFGKNGNIFESEKNIEELAKYTMKAIDFANTIGCKNLVFGCPKNRNINDYNKDYPKAIQFFKNIGKYALEKNVVIAIEPNPVIYNTNFLNYTKEAIDFAKEINMDSIKVNYDLGTVIYNKEDINMLKENIKYINHIHISEPNLDLIKDRQIHKELISILKDVDYKGYVSIEMKKSDNIEDVKNVIEYISSIL